ncbi:hypothetical protein BIV57_02845 [Mangrovactinospora gilvigrisea]|uniref:Sporulation protein SsgA n=1 Tax=Mangrovactinospora gilvigrisea TaxID=1428644 RepID=A0A1J7CH07_9ACTN|nr:hypothetical protein BIV57_02845 [Mangrovactinospora gilvigrisea]
MRGPLDRREKAEPRTAAAELTLRHILSARVSTPVPTRIGYRTDDPFAVSVEFRPPGEVPVLWVFSRELLASGLHRAVGRGDVRIWPTGKDGSATVCLAFESPAGRALFEADAVPLRIWLARTFRLVPPGSEPSHISWDAAIAALLAGGADASE